MALKAAFMVPHPPMILPDIGRGSEEQIKETTKAYEQVARDIADLEPETIIITSPHSIMYADYIHISPGRSADGSFADFGAPKVRFHVDYDTKLADEICALAISRDFPAGTDGERDPKLDHGTMVPLWFIENAFDKDFKILRIGLSGLSLAEHYRMGQIINDAINNTNREVVLVASGDLSHKLQEHGPYGFASGGPEYDSRIMDVCGRGAFGELFAFDEAFCRKAAECGHKSFVIMAGAFDGVAVDAKAISHQDVTGVGYGICSFYPLKPDDDRHFLDKYIKETEEKLLKNNSSSDPYVNLARKSLESYVLRGDRINIPAGLPRDMEEKKAGAFVSIHKHGDLRGCIGTIGPTKDCVAMEIIENAISAAVRDPRFPPIGPDELEELDISVDVLGEPEDISSPEELDVKRYGVIVSSTGKRGLLLPDLEGIDTVEQQIEIAKQKAGIHRFETIKLQRFEVIRHE